MENNLTFDILESLMSKFNDRPEIFADATVHPEDYYHLCKIVNEHSATYSPGDVFINGVGPFRVQQSLFVNRGKVVLAGTKGSIVIADIYDPGKCAELGI